MATQRRAHKVSAKVQELIANEVLRAGDPRFFLVTITSVVMSSDLRQAKVYWVVSGDEERRREVGEAFQEAGGSFRHALSKGLGMRFAPVLKFFYDDTLDVLDEVNRLLEKSKR